MTTSTLQVLGCGAPVEAEGGWACGPRSWRAAASSKPNLGVPVGPPRPTRAAASPALGARVSSPLSPGTGQTGGARAHYVQPGLNCRLAAAPPPLERAQDPEVAPGGALTRACHAPWQHPDLLPTSPRFLGQPPFLVHSLDRAG